MTIGREIQSHSKVRPDHPAVVSFGSTPLSYRELQYLIDEIRMGLRHAGFGRKARIAVGLPDGPQAALAIVAMACSAVPVPLNPKQTVAEIEAHLANLRLDAILLFQGNDSIARRVAERRRLAIVEAIPAREGALGFKIIVPQAHTSAPPDEPDEPDPDAPVYILQTSGTTAEPKLIPFSHRNMLATAARLQAWFKLTPQDRCLSANPVYYAHALTATVFPPLLTGGTLVFPANASKFDYSEWFGTLKPTWYSAGPTLHGLILDQSKSRADAKTAHSLRFILSAGAPLPRKVQEGLQHTLGVPVMQYYGSSEAGPISVNLPPPGPSKLGTCGLPWPDTVIIAGENGCQLPPGEQGEILMRGPNVMSGYLDAPELNRASFIDGWLKTGDIGSLDEEGFLTLHGRQKDLINRGGEKIWPIEIDDALMRHPAVAEAAAFAVPHPRLGEDVAAAVVLRPGINALPGELRRYLGEHLASFKVPRRIIILDQLPKGMTGKILRRHLGESLGTASPVAFRGPSDDLERDLCAIWQEDLELPKVGIDDDFFELGGDSLQAVIMFAEIEARLGCSLSPTTIIQAPTVARLAEFIRANTGIAASQSLVPLRASGTGLPLFFGYERFGFAMSHRHMVSDLKSDRPIFSLQPLPLDGKHRVAHKIELMAADCVTEIQRVQPHGPYFLAGHSFAGLVSFEIAQQLVRDGERVSFLGLIDTLLEDTRVEGRPRPSAAARVGRKIRDAHGFQDLLFRGLRFIGQQPGVIRGELLFWQYDAWIRQGRSIPHEYRPAYFDRLGVRAYRDYVPKPYPGHITMFSSAGNCELQRAHWEPLARDGLTVLEMPVGHNDMILPPHSKLLAEHFDACLDAIVRGEELEHRRLEKA